jgi:antitoxin ParD1/3/4
MDSQSWFAQSPKSRRSACVLQHRRLSKRVLRMLVRQGIEGAQSLLKTDIHVCFKDHHEKGIMNVSLTPELEKFVDDKVESGLYNNASEVVRESLRLLKEHDEIRLKWREQIERGWLDAQAGRVVDGPKTMADARTRLKNMSKKRA